MVNWVKEDSKDSSKYTTEVAYLNDDKTHKMVVHETANGSYICYFDDFTRVKHYLEGKHMDEAKEIIVEFVKTIASNHIKFYGNVLSCLEIKE